MAEFERIQRPPKFWECPNCEAPPEHAELHIVDGGTDSFDRIILCINCGLTFEFEEGEEIGQFMRGKNVR